MGMRGICATPGGSDIEIFDFVNVAPVKTAQENKAYFATV